MFVVNEKKKQYSITKQLIITPLNYHISAVSC